VVHFNPFIPSTAESSHRRSTRTSLNREPELILIELIRPTNKATPWSPSRIQYSPICLVRHSNGFLYIVDGNHRFYKKVQFEKDIKKIPAWILEEGDKEDICGNPLPTILADWKAGKTTLERLAKGAEVEWRRLKHGHPPPNKISNPFHPNKAKQSPELPHHVKFSTVIQVIQGKISIKTASKNLSLPISTVRNWVHRSLQAVRDVLLE
jgi:hypothetical protein